MIGPAEITDMLADYTEALAVAGAPLDSLPSWPVTSPTAPDERCAIDLPEALQRLRDAATHAIPR